MGINLALRLLIALLAATPHGTMLYVKCQHAFMLYKLLVNIWGNLLCIIISAIVIHKDVLNWTIK